MSRNIAPFGVRMPEELKETLLKKAEENKRSLNAEVVARLEETVRQDEKFNNSPFGYESILTALEDEEHRADDLQDKLDSAVPIEEQGLLNVNNISHSIEELKELIKSRFPKDE